MNSPMPSLLLPLWQNESLSETIGMKIYVTCMVIRMKSSDFHGKRLAQALVLQIETRTVEVKVYICAKRPIRPALIKNNLTKKQFTIFSWSVYNVRFKALDIRRVVQGSLWHGSRTLNTEDHGSRIKKISFSRITKIRK